MGRADRLLAMIWVFFLGVVCEVAGLVAIGLGLRSRWKYHEHKLGLADRIRAALLAQPDRLPKQAKVRTADNLVVTLGESAMATDDASVERWPDPSVDAASFADAVRAKLEKSASELAALRSRLDQDREQQQAAADAMKNELESRVNQARDEARVATVLGYNADFVGWLLLLLGVLLGAVAGGFYITE
jgi:hypothetical protein